MIRPVVLIPSYNTGSVLKNTLEDALKQTHHPIRLVIDGSNDGSAEMAIELAKREARLKVLVISENSGKGAAVRTGLMDLQDEAFTHVLVMDADGQHPAEDIDRFFEYAESQPEAMILGQPLFDDTVPVERLYGRKLSVWVVFIEVLGNAIGDPLFGFRVYPIGPLLKVMDKPGRSNRYDFDPEVAVRLNWMGVPSLKANARVKYIRNEEGGISHFHYFRDNVRFVCLHAKLLIQAPFHWLNRNSNSRSVV